MPNLTRTFTVADLADLDVPPDSNRDGWTSNILADEHVANLKDTQRRRCVFVDDGGEVEGKGDGRVWAVEYEAGLGDYEPQDHGWLSTVTATAMEERQVTVTQWLPVETDGVTR